MIESNFKKVNYSEFRADSNGTNYSRLPTIVRESDTKMLNKVVKFASKFITNHSTPS